MSHVITFPSGKVGETFDANTVNTARRLGMKVETIHEYLGRINREIKERCNYCLSVDCSDPAHEFRAI
jgi:hypothetical protein